MCWLDGVKKSEDREVDWNRKNEESQLLKVLREAMYMFCDGLADKKFGKNFTKTQINTTLLIFHKLRHQGGNIQYYSTVQYSMLEALK